MSAPDVLPDSRLRDKDFSTVLCDWPLDGKTVRIECAPVFCANCGKPWGFVPKENTTFAFWLCNACYETYGAVVGTYAVADDAFNQKVTEEIRARFGRDLTAEEIALLADQGQLGTSLELLMRESPYKVFRGE